MKVFKALFQSISEFFANVRDTWCDFWRLGPKAWLRGIYLDFQDLKDSILAWKHRATTKPSEEERQLAKKHRALKLQDFAHDFREGLVGLLTSPWRFASGLWTSLLRLREMSFRDAAGHLWESYVAGLASLLNRIAGWWRSFLQFPFWLRGVYTFLLVTLLSFGAASPWLIKTVKDYRASEMLSEARAQQGSGDLVKAYMKSRAAALMRPGDTEALKLVMDLADNVGAPEAIWWSERMAETQGQDADSINRIVETALRHRRINKAEQSFALMKSRHPGHESLAETEVRLLLAQNKEIEAMHRAMIALRTGDGTPLLHEVYVGSSLRSSNERLSDQGLEHLEQHVYRNDEVGLALARLVFTTDLPLPEEEGSGLDYERLIAMVESNEQASAGDRINAYGMALRMGIMDQATAEEKILEQFDLEDRNQLLVGLSRLGALGLYESYDRIITPELLASDREFVLARIAGLTLSQEPDLDAAEAVLEGMNTEGVARISDAKTALWQAVIAGRKNDSEAMTRETIAAVDQSGSREFGYLSQIMAQTAEPEQLLLFYRELFEHSGRHPDIASRYLVIAYNYAEENELGRLVQSLPIDRLKQHPQSQALLIYLKFLYAPESQQVTRRYAEQLAVDYPGDLAYLICLAYAYAQSGQQNYARRLIASWDPEGSLQNLQPFLQLSYLTVNGEQANRLDPESLPTARERELLERILNGNET